MICDFYKSNFKLADKGHKLKSLEQLAILESMEVKGCKYAGVDFS